jgi:hypothetical protein
VAAGAWRGGDSGSSLEPRAEATGEECGLRLRGGGVRREERKLG